MNAAEKTHVEAILDLADEAREAATKYLREGVPEKAALSLMVAKEAYDCYSKLVYASGLVFYFNRYPTDTK